MSGPHDCLKTLIVGRAGYECLVCGKKFSQKAIDDILEGAES